jgi:hypothetical protein
LRDELGNFKLLFFTYRRKKIHKKLIKTSPYEHDHDCPLQNDNQNMQTVINSIKDVHIYLTKSVNYKMYYISYLKGQIQATLIQ